MHKLIKLKIAMVIFIIVVSIAAAQTLLGDSVRLKYDSKYSVYSDLINQGYKAISLGKNGSGKYYCYIRIKGRQFNFIIDTGANRSTIRKNFADTLRLTKFESMKMTKRDIDLHNIDSYLCKIDSLWIGNFLIDTVMVFADKKFEIMMQREFDLFLEVSKEKLVSTAGLGLEDGIIGDDILSSHKAVIDLNHFTLYLKP